MKAAIQVLLLFILSSSCALGQRLFTPKDDVEIALFEYAGIGAPGGVIKYSPDAKHFAVVTERGRLEQNAPEDTIWIFSTDRLQRFMLHSKKGDPPAPLRLVQVAGDKDGPVIENVRWLADSSGVA